MKENMKLLMYKGTASNQRWSENLTAGMNYSTTVTDNQIIDDLYVFINVGLMDDKGVSRLDHFACQQSNVTKRRAFVDVKNSCNKKVLFA